MGERERTDAPEKAAPEFVEVAAVVGRLAREAEHHREEVLRTVREFEERETKMLLGRLLVGDVDRGGEDAPPVAVHVDRLEPDPVPALVAVRAP